MLPSMIWVAKNLYFFNCLLDGAHTTDNVIRPFETAALRNQSHRFFTSTQTYDEFSRNIVANSDLNCYICLKIKKFLMNLLHIPTFANFHQDIILYIPVVH